VHQAITATRNGGLGVAVPSIWPQFRPLRMTEGHQPDDAALARRIARGDSEALGALYDRYASVAMATAMRVVRDQAQAEDVVHDCFVAAWQRIGSFDASRGSVRSWLLTIVRNRAIDRVRGRRPSIDVDSADEQSLLRTSADPTQDDAMQQLGADEVRRAIANLPDEQRTAIELAYFGGHTYREIAVMTGVPRGTASGRLRLALAKLREALRGTEAAPISISGPRTEVEA
jgi:RNA polymerase sigma-70 factor, ECF subfamily